MKHTLRLIGALTATLAASAALAQANTVKAGAIYYQTHSSTTGIQGIGIPPGADAKTGNASTLLNYHFGTAGDAFRPYLGAGINYTRFVSIRSTLAPQVEMSDSTGLAVQAGFDYAITPQWGFFGSIARVDVKSKLVAVASTVLTTEINFRPVTYSVGLLYRF